MRVCAPDDLVWPELQGSRITEKYALTILTRFESGKPWISTIITHRTQVIFRWLLFKFWSLKPWSVSLKIVWLIHLLPQLLHWPLLLHRPRLHRPRLHRPRLHRPQLLQQVTLHLGIVIWLMLWLVSLVLNLRSKMHFRNFLLNLLRLTKIF